MKLVRCLLAIIVPLGSTVIEDGGIQVKEQRSVIITSGRGEVQVVPDRVLFQIGVDLSHKDLQELQQDAGKRMHAVMGALQKCGIGEGDFYTADYRITRDWNSESRKYVGYRIRHMVQVSIQDWDQVGAIVQRTVSAGATEIGSFDPVVTDVASSKQEARKLAVADAMERARTMADQAGYDLGEIVTLSDEEESHYQPSYQRTYALAESSAPQFEPGDRTLSAEVHLKIRLKSKQA